jgi:hypothetical protein
MGILLAPFEAIRVCLGMGWVGFFGVYLMTLAPIKLRADYLFGRISCVFFIKILSLKQ